MHERGVVLAVEDLSVNDERGLPAVKGVSFEVRAQEIVGIAGVSGNGQSELALALTGLMPVAGGQIKLDGRLVHNLTPRALSKIGFAHIPEDRHRMGVILPFSVADNFILHDYYRPPYARRGFLASRKILNHAWELAQKFDVRLSDVADEIAHLSGGNEAQLVHLRGRTAHEEATARRDWIAGAASFA